jgi:outer membrane protein assembly factor BamB
MNRNMINTTLLSILGFSIINLCIITPVYAQSDIPWPMAGANPQRTSRTQEEVSGNLNPLWYKIFEPYILPRTQVIGVEGKLFIATSKGLYALLADDGTEIWVYPTEFPLADTPTYDNGVLFVSSTDKKIHAISAATGNMIWTFTAKQAFNVSPLVINNTVYAGNRDGNFYALDALTGAEKWRYSTGGPINFGAAYLNNSVFFASNDSHAYALNATTGSLIWKSNKLPGLGFHSWWPVIAGEHVIFAGSSGYRSTIPVYGLSLSNHIEKKDVYPNYQTDPDRSALIAPKVAYSPTDPNWSWAHGVTVLDASKPNTNRLDGTPTQTTAITEYFEIPTAEDLSTDPSGLSRHIRKPWRRTLFVLSQSNGQEYTTDFDNDGQREYAPFLWFSIHSGNRYPPVIGNDGIVYTPNNYYTSPSIPWGNVVGWKIGTPYVSLINDYSSAVDEPLSLTMGGNILYINKCCDRVTQPKMS